jgi:hypothetical protein
MDLAKKKKNTINSAFGPWIAPPSAVDQVDDGLVAA